MVEDMLAYNAKKNNGYNYAEHILITEYVSLEERMQLIMEWANKLEELKSDKVTMFTLTIRQMFSYNKDRISDVDFIRLYRIFISGGGKESHKDIGGN